MILITGASGRIGRRTAELLAGEGHSLRLMTRSPEKAAKLKGSQIVRGDFAEPASLKSAFEGVRAALVISGSGQPGERAKLHRNAFLAARDGGAQHVVYLSLKGAGPDSRYPFSRDHYLSEQYLFETGTPCTILRNAFYLDMFPDKFEADGAIRGPAGDGRGAFVAREDVARTAAAVLGKPPGGVQNAIEEVTGPEALSVADIARRLSTLAGRPLRYEDQSARAMRNRLAQPESLEWQIDLAVGWFEAIAAGEVQPATDTVLRLTGTAPLTLEAYFKAFPELLSRLRQRA